jgi:hypothetical protein
MRTLRIVWALVALAAAHAAVVTPPARADIDASGPWAATSPFLLDGCHVDFTQDGTSLSITGDCGFALNDMTGTIDPVSGVAHLEASSPFFICSAEILDIVVAPDSRSFTGTDTCVGFLTVQVTGSRCGNRVLDAGEECDDGNLNPFDCCDTSCHPAPSGASCNVGNPCVAATCDGMGVCQQTDLTGPCDDFNPCTADDTCIDGECLGTELADGTTCDDEDGCTTGDSCHFGYCYGDTPITCDPCEQCFSGVGCQAAPRYSCYEPADPKAKLALHDANLDARDRVSWTWSGGEADVLDFGDPRKSTDYALCVFEELGYGRTLLKSAVPAGGRCSGRPCWTGKRTGYRYFDATGGTSGITSIVMKSGAAGKAGIVVQGHGGKLDLQSLPVRAPVIAQLQSSDGECWSAVYASPSANNPIDFRATGGTSDGVSDEGPGVPVGADR